MLSSENIFIIALVTFNLLGGLWGAITIAKLMSKAKGKCKRVFRYLVFLIGVYCAECVAFSMGMATQVLTIGLAFVWGIVFGLWLRKHTSTRMGVKTALLLALYSCLPTASFCVLIPVARLIGGGNILSVSGGTAFGIPDFLPWPTNTIIGFSAVLLIGTILLKTIITVSLVRLLIHRGQKSADNSFQGANA